MSSKQYFVASGHLVGTGTTTDAAYWVNDTPHTLKPESICLVDVAGITAHDTNYATITVVAGGTTIATEATTTGDTGDITAGARTAVAISDVDELIAPNEVVKFNLAKAGSGVAVDAFVVLTMLAVRDIT